MSRDNQEIRTTTVGESRGSTLTSDGRRLLANVTPSVVISVGSRFHAFDLARELERDGMLKAIYTGYPRLVTKRFDLPVKQVRSVVSHELLNRLLGRLHQSGWIKRRQDAWLSRRFDQIVARRIKPGGNVFVGWSSQCLQSLAAARSFGMKTIVERGSTHILWQHAILKEEAALTGLPVELPDEKTIERELAEYDAADKIAVPSQFVAKTFVDQGVAPERLLINPYGVDTGRFQPRKRLSRSPDGALNVIHVGRVSARKGVQYLVTATERISGVKLLLVGGIDRGMDQVLNRPHVSAIGPVPGSQLPDYYSSADVFCLLSIEEGLALVLAQAMAMMLPIIATHNTGAGEFITDGVEGFLVPPRDPATVAARLRLLADDPALRAEMGARGRSRIESGFSWSSYGIRAKELYRGLLSNMARV